MLPKQLNANIYKQSADSKEPMQVKKKSLLTLTSGGGGVAKLCPTLATP